MTNKDAMGREPIQIIEIDQDFCGLSYGVAPCAAAIGVTGTDKCFNTFKTCQDVTNYDRQSKTIRFTRPRSNMPAEKYLIPCLESVSTSPTIINVAGGDKNKKALGVRATLTATFFDIPHNDNRVDPYKNERSYIAIDRSTFWAKWLARNPYYQNRVIRVLDGYIGQSLSEMTSRTYLIESIDGPGSNGRVTIKAKDVLNLTDESKSQAPIASTGELIDDIDDTITTLRITEAEASDYPAPGIVRVNDELITYTGVSTISPTEINVTGCVRGTNNTAAASHSSDDRVQWCLEYDNVNCVDITTGLLLNYAKLDASWIPAADWNAERDQWLPQFNVSAIITEPTSVNTLLSELTQQCAYYIWWDERAQEVKLRAVKPATEVPTRINESRNILENSITITERPKERISQVWIFYNQADPTRKLDEENNYPAVKVTADLGREDATQYGESVIRKIYSRWIKSSAQAVSLGAKMLARFKDNPAYMSVDLDAKDRDLWTGDLVDVTTRQLVNQYGEEIETRFQIIKAEERESGHLMRYELQKFVFTGRFAFIMASDAPDFTAATPEQKENGCWIANSAGLMSDGSDPYRIQ